MPDEAIKSRILTSIEALFELHSGAMGDKKRKVKLKDVFRGQ